MRPLRFLIALALVFAPALATAQTEAQVDTLELARLSPEELFLRASSSALQFEHMREPSRVILAREHERSLSYLVTRLDTDDARERHALEDILVRIGEPAVATVTAALSVEVRRTDTTRGARLAAGVLGLLGDPAAVAELATAHAHPDWKVRGAVAGALGRIGGAGAVGPLVALLSDENETVRKSAAVGLGRAASQDEGATTLDERAERALTDALGDSNYSVRYGAAGALGKMGESVVSVLVAEARDGSRLVRLMAVRALAGTGSRKALRPLTDLLSHEDWATRAFAAEALGDIGPDRKARRKLEKVAEEDEHPLASAKARDALARGPS
jgi:HEAT repeat protein